MVNAMKNEKLFIGLGIILVVAFAYQAGFFSILIGDYISITDGGTNVLLGQVKGGSIHNFVNQDWLYLPIQEPSDTWILADLIISKERYINSSINDFYTTHRVVETVGGFRRYQPDGCGSGTTIPCTQEDLDVTFWQDIFPGGEFGVVSPGDDFRMEMHEWDTMKRVIKNTTIIFIGNYSDTETGALTGDFETYGFCELWNGNCWIRNPSPEETRYLRNINATLFVVQNGTTEEDICPLFGINCPPTLITIYRFENNACTEMEIEESARFSNDYDTLTECESHIIPPTSQNKTYYRFENNACTIISLLEEDKTSNDYTTIALCQAHIVLECATATDCNTLSHPSIPGQWVCVSNDCSWEEDPECDAGDKLYETCDDGTKVDWCDCSNGEWDCVDSPKDQCPQAEECLLTFGGYCLMTEYLIILIGIIALVVFGGKKR